MAVLDALQAPRTLPHSEESERAVLAGILLEPQVLATVAARLVEGDFYFERHQRIYRAMLDLQAAGTDVDLRTLEVRLEQQAQIDAVGGLAYLAGLDVATCPTSAASTPTSRSSRSARCAAASSRRAATSPARRSTAASKPTRR